MAEDPANGKCRIDKWLWAARFYKTRALATDAVLGGHVQVNGARVKPAKDVRVGDVVQIRIGTIEWIVDVRGLADRRGPASVARELYEERAGSKEARERQVTQRRLAKPLGADLGARPTKQDRRRLDALRRAQRRAR
jgi:ribosome-associated heat shock protein Hsp15